MLNNLRILLAVDSDPLYAQRSSFFTPSERAQRQLQTFGAIVSIAEDETDFLHKVASGSYQLALIDSHFDWTDLRKPVQEARKYGATSVVLVNDKLSDISDYIAFTGEKRVMPIDHKRVHPILREYLTVLAKIA